MMKNIMLFALLVVGSILNVSAQNTTDDKQITAFSQSYESEKVGEYPKAIQYMKDVYTENSYELNLRLGWLYYSSGLFTDALPYYQKAMALMPYSIEAKFGYVLPASALGNWEQVITQYKEILKIDSKNSVVHYRLGSIYYGRKDYEQAYKHLEQGANLYPFDYNLNILFAWTNFQLGKRNEAKALFFRVLKMSPGDSSALEGLKLLK